VSHFREFFFRFLADFVTVDWFRNLSWALAASSQNVHRYQEDLAMLPRMTKCVLFLAAVCSVGIAHAQHSPPPLHLSSIEWLVADNDVVVRGVVVDVATDQSWNIVTLDVRETLKGAKTERFQFAAHRFEQGDAALAESKQSKREGVWLLKRHESAARGEAPDREKVLARHKLNLHAPFLPGRPGKPALPLIPLGVKEDADKAHQPLAFFTIDLRLLQTSDELVKAIRTAIAENPASARSYSVSLPEELTQFTGFNWPQQLLTVPIDGRLEAAARRLVQSPSDFLTKRIAAEQLQLRIEGVKALRLFPAERNLAIVRTWLDNPLSHLAFQDDRKTVVPVGVLNLQANTALPTELAEVPEIHFQRPLTKAVKTEHAQLHTAVNIDSVILLNQNKTDAFMEALISKRPDLGGLSFAMGDACRLKPEAGQQFVAALEVFRKVEGQISPPSSLFPSAQQGNQPKEKTLVERYKHEAAEKKIDPSASVATLMQVLGPEDAKVRLGLAEYLDGVANADATRALAKLAIFSAEPEIRAAAVSALKKREAKDFSEILVAGLTYPWPAVAERATDVMVKLGRKDLVPHLIDVLDRPDPRAPQSREKDGKPVTFVRELVRVNHHHNCLLCHAPAAREKSPNEETAKFEALLTAQVPVPSESMVAYYRPSVPDILVRFDVTYLRQDFSIKIKVADAEPWPEMQRYDFLVRTRELTEAEARAYQGLLGTASPYRRAVLSALRDLTGLDAEPTAAAWRKLTGL